MYSTGQGAAYKNNNYPFAIETNFKLCIYFAKTSMRASEVCYKFSIRANFLLHSFRTIIKQSRYEKFRLDSTTVRPIVTDRINLNCRHLSQFLYGQTILKNCLTASSLATDGGNKYANNSVNCSKRMRIFKTGQSTVR
jgi:hypothetical protein